MKDDVKKDLMFIFFLILGVLGVIFFASIF